MNNDITILTVVEKDPGLLELMGKSLNKFADQELHFFICDNTNGKNWDRIRLMAPNWNIQIFNNDPKILGGSGRHGSGLNKLFKHVKTKYTAVVESDVVVLDKDWNKIRPGFSAKAAVKKDNSNIYHTCFFICETNRLYKNNVPIDFMPGGNKGKKKLSNNQNYEWDNDAGWRVGNYIGLDMVDKMDFVDCKSGNGIYFGSTFQSDEFHYQGKCIAAHFGRGSNLGGKAIRKGFKRPEEQLKEWKKIVEQIIQ